MEFSNYIGQLISIRTELQVKFSNVDNKSQKQKYCNFTVNVK